VTHEPLWPTCSASTRKMLSSQPEGAFSIEEPLVVLGEDIVEPFVEVLVLAEPLLLTLVIGLAMEVFVDGK